MHALLLMITAASSHGQILHLAADINTTFGPLSSNPANFSAAGPLVYFTAAMPGTGQELCITDGTTLGTRLISELLPGSSSPECRPVASLGTDLLFIATTPDAGRQLWRSNGTASGTIRLTSTLSAVADDFANKLVVNGRLFFAATSPSSGNELWVSDGSPTGTRQVAEIATGVSHANPTFLTELNGRVFFAAGSGAQGRELWATDGTTAGTSMVANIYPGGGSSDPRNLVRIGNEIWFSAISQGKGSEPWKTDGTASGTVPIADLIAGTAGSTPAEFAPCGNRVIFSATTQPTGNELFISDGTSAGTMLLKDIVPGTAPSSPRYMTPIGARAIFVDASQTLLCTDSSTQGTISTGYKATTTVFNPFIVQDDVAYFFGTDAKGNAGLIVTDGTLAGTRLAVPGLLQRTINPAGSLALLKSLAQPRAVGFLQQLYVEPVAANLATGSTTLLRTSDLDSDPNCSLLTLAGDAVYFALSTPRSGREPWISRGEPESTQLLAELGDGSGALSSRPRALHPYAGKMAFVADSNNSYETVFITDGYPSTTFALKKNAPRADSGLFTLQGQLCFIAPSSDNTHGAVWASTDQPGSAYPLLGDDDDLDYLEPRYAFGSGVILSAYYGVGYVGILYTDGTPQNTRSLVISNTNYEFGNFRTAHGLAYFAANTTTNGGSELWVCDGPTARMVRDTDLIGPGAQPASMTALGPYVLYAARSPNGDRELWRTDGTPEYTQPFIDIHPTASSNPRALERVGSSIVFVADDPASLLPRFFVTDGTAAGTHVVPGNYLPLASNAGNLAPVVFNGRYYAIARTSTGRAAVWSSDGTVAGTLHFFGAAIEGFEALALHATPTRLFIRATTPDRGEELWISDGTSAGTVAAPEPTPGPASSKPGPVTGVFNRVFFAADHPQVGRELFMIDLCPADFDNDGQVTQGDLEAWLAAFDAGDLHADTDGSGFVDTDDFETFIASMERGC
jgi:ELWxxDGT repeat protein